MGLILPKEKSTPKVNNPKFLILFGRPKAGKSTLMANLDNNLIIDLENGYQALSALIVQARTVNDFAEIANALNKKPFYIQKTSELTRFYTKKELLELFPFTEEALE